MLRLTQIGKVLLVTPNLPLSNVRVHVLVKHGFEKHTPKL